MEGTLGRYSLVTMIWLPLNPEEKKTENMYRHYALTLGFWEIYSKTLGAVGPEAARTLHQTPLSQYISVDLDGAVYPPYEAVGRQEPDGARKQAVDGAG